MPAILVSTWARDPQSPIKRLFVGAEYIFGQKRTQNRSHGVDHRGQLSFQFKAL